MNTFRIIDANINRVCEGIRVIEDILRFFYDNEIFFKKLKTIRHEIRKNTEYLNIEVSRKPQHDVGKKSFLQEEITRKNFDDIFKANIKRVEEGLRVLEEIFKIENKDFSEFFKSKRFEIYNIEKKIYSKKFKFQNLLKNKPILYGIVDTRFSKFDHITITENLIKGGIKIIQLREKILKEEDRKFLRIAKEMRKICNDNDAIFIINDRVDIAILSDADGVHLGQDDIKINDARKIFGFDRIYGLSTHNYKQVEESIKIKPDYIGYGPIFQTKSKENPDPTVGIESLKKLKDKFKNIPPIVAIGGINLTNIKEVISCKPEMICVMSGIIGNENIETTVKKYMEIINDSVRSC